VAGLWLRFADFRAQKRGQLGIEFKVADVSSEHRELVRKPFMEAYLAGIRLTLCSLQSGGKILGAA
jgi:tRNA U34 2-thiouridine synthase MnmA/TrmU